MLDYVLMLFDVTWYKPFTSLPCIVGDFFFVVDALALQNLIKQLCKIICNMLDATHFVSIDEFLLITICCHEFF